MAIFHIYVPSWAMIMCKMLEQMKYKVNMNETGLEGGQGILKKQ